MEKKVAACLMTRKGPHNEKLVHITKRSDHALCGCGAHGAVACICGLPLVELSNWIGLLFGLLAAAALVLPLRPRKAAA